MLRDYIRAAFHERCCRLLLRRRIIPRERPHDFNRDVWVDRPRAEREGVQAGDHRRNRLRGNEPDLV